MSIRDYQVGGDHYKKLQIQPVEYIYANELDFLEGNIVKYVTRHRTKGEGAKDIKKVIHYAQMILELRYGDKINASTN
tara:strand:+ start:324 stop:557 length:234 start_codon:yes stop_codon:yes gene_type:complete